MRTLFILSFLTFLSFEASAQNYDMYVSLQDGKRTAWKLFRTGYGTLRYTNAGNTDTLICSGEGYELGKIDKNISHVYGDIERSVYKSFNKAIRIGKRKALRSGENSGDLVVYTKNGVARINFTKDLAKIILKISIE